MSDDGSKKDFKDYCEILALSKDERLLCEPLNFSNLLFVLDGQCIIEVQTANAKRTVAKAFAGALIGDLNQFSEVGATLTIIAQSDLRLLKLSENSIVRMRNERADLYSRLNEFLVSVLRNSLLSAKKLIDSHI